MESVKSARDVEKH